MVGIRLDEASSENSSALIVLGYHELGGDGSHGISAVCRACVARAQQLPAEVVIFSGWSSVGGRSEAEQMRDLWAAPGPELVVEPRARNTAENAVYSLELVRERGIGKATVVCAINHRIRVPFFFGGLYRSQGIDVGYEYVSRPLARPRVWLREAGAIALMWHQRRATVSG
jgi:uncharacterized SAM-binding protein YcdF (DUF218 family)